VNHLALTRQLLAQQVADLAGVSHVDITGALDLTTLGIGSLDIMRLVNGWRVRGLPVTFRQLADEPTLDAWHAVLSHLLRAHPHLAA
jgi:aryl carrier-like protein